MSKCLPFARDVAASYCWSGLLLGHPVGVHWATTIHCGADSKLIVCIEEVSGRQLLHYSIAVVEFINSKFVISLC